MLKAVRQHVIVSALVPHGGPAAVQEGDTALHRAAFWGYTRVVETLVAGGADVNAENQVS